MILKNKTNPIAGRSSIADCVSWLIVGVSTIVLPLVVSTAGRDVFRLPKQLLFDATGILLAAVAACAAIFGASPTHARRWPAVPLALVAAVLVWSTATAIASTNVTLSLQSLIIAAAAVMFFIAAHNAARNRSLSMLYIALAPALVNAAVAITQWTGIWSPFTIQAAMWRRDRTLALLGNANDVGMFLVAPVLTAAALAITSRKHRPVAIIAAVILTGGLIASETVGAIAALAVGLLLMFFPIRPTATIVATVVFLSVAVAGVYLSPARWTSMQTKLAAAEKGDWDPLLSGRLPPFFAAWHMFREHPLLGVGPGCFPFNYFDAKIEVELEHAFLRQHGGENFGEVHNEHLQILAEGGLPAYAIFIAALIALAQISFHGGSNQDETRAEFARHLALPLAAAFAVLTLTSFPLRLAAPTTSILFICAVIVAWSEDEGA